MSSSRLPFAAKQAAWGGLVPRRWQVEAMAAVRAAVVSGVRSPIVHACTGAGKSRLLAEFAATTRGRVLLTTPTQSLVRQLSATIEERCPGEVGRAYQHAWETDRRIVVTCHASLQTLVTERPEWSTWLADEAHKLEGDELRVAREAIRRKLAIGLTATPFRSDGRALIWDRQVYSYSAAQAVDDGVLVPWRWVRLHEGCILDHKGQPDVDANCAVWVRSATGPGIVSAVSIVDAETYAARLTEEGAPARAIHSRLPHPEQARRVEMLKSGELRCLVHVNLLAEGVDLPWLTWLALRRRVASPVRLVQEVGRVLRAAPGKTEAVLYDPHALSASIGLDHPSQIDAVLEAAEAPKPEPEDEPLEIPALEGLGELATMPPGVVVPRLEGWLIDLRSAMVADRLMAHPTLYPGLGWRQKRVTDRQREAIAKALRWRGRLPDQRHRDAIRWLGEQADLRAGTASDLLDVLYAMSRLCREYGYNWKLPARLVPELS